MSHQPLSLKQFAIHIDSSSISIFSPYFAKLSELSYEGTGKIPTNLPANGQRPSPRGSAFVPKSDELFERSRLHSDDLSASGD